MIEQWFLNNKKKLLEINSPILPCVRDALVLLDSDDSNLEKVADSISKDPLLSAKLLMLANSPFYGLSREVANLNEVLVVLGGYRVKSLLITASVDSWKGEVDEDLKMVWQHSVAVAIFCEHFASKLNLDKKNAYLLGLLHEVILFKIDYLDLEFTDDIDDLLGYCMPRMLKIWDFPQDLIGAVDRYYKKLCKQNDVLPLAHCVANSLLFSHARMPSVNVIESENLLGKDFEFWLHDSNEIIKKITSLRC